jgi:hypothetical protein
MLKTGGIIINSYPPAPVPQNRVESGQSIIKGGTSRGSLERAMPNEREKIAYPALKVKDGARIKSSRHDIITQES